jgi:hypothetical protein
MRKRRMVGGSMGDYVTEPTCRSVFLVELSIRQQYVRVDDEDRWRERENGYIRARLRLLTPSGCKSARLGAVGGCDG